eukprot:5225425-Amphidinium_carterae.1
MAGVCRWLETALPRHALRYGVPRHCGSIRTPESNMEIRKLSSQAETQRIEQDKGGVQIHR